MERLDFENKAKELIEKKLHDYKIKYNTDSNMNIIKIDFIKDDFKTIISNYEKIKKQYFIVNKKMNVVYSDEFNKRIKLLTKFQMQMIKEIENRLLSCESIKPYLSTNVYLSKFSKSDELLDNHNIYHMHLSAPDKNEHFVTRTGKLLFITYDYDNVYFLDVKKHPQGDEWNDINAIEIRNNMNIKNDYNKLFNGEESSLYSKLEKIYNEINDDEIENELKKYL